jgi:tripartite-type tricarboxylate transporter receptor subunit TctC
MMNGRMRAAAGAALIALGAAASSALAQSYPAKTIRYIIAFPPGGSNDILARIIGARMTELMGQTVIIDNRPGGGANIGVEAIARAPRRRLYHRQYQRDTHDQRERCIRSSVTTS